METPALAILLGQSLKGTPQRKDKIMYVNTEECNAAGLDPKEVERIAAGLSRYGRQARNLGITVFGGSGSGELRFDDNIGYGSLKIAYLEGTFDGGAGADQSYGDGLQRGE